MTWYNSILDWLATTGVQILIVILVAIAAYVGWGLVCKLLIKALITSTIKAREAVMKSKFKLAQSAKTGGKRFSHLSQDFGSKLKGKLTDKSIDHEDEDGTEIKLDNTKDDNDDDYAIAGDGDKPTTNDTHAIVADNDDEDDDKEVQLDAEFETIKLSDEIRQAMEERAHTIGGVVKGVGNFAITVMIGIMFLDAINVSTAPLLTIAGLFGIAVALAAKDAVSDYIGGAVILAENQYFHGEIVIINGYMGAVEDFSLRVTKLRAKNGDLRIIPNGEIREVTNKSRVFSVACITVMVPYETEDDYDKAEDCLSNTIVPQLKDEEDIIKVLYTPNITVKCFALLDGAVKIRMTVKVRTGFADTVQQKMMKFVRIQFQKNDIIIQSLEAGMKSQNPDGEEDDEEESDGPF